MTRIETPATFADAPEASRWTNFVNEVRQTEADFPVVEARKGA